MRGRRAVVVSLVLVVLAGAVVASGRSRIRRFEAQVNNLILFGGYHRQLRRHFDEHGFYPVDLSQIDPRFTGALPGHDWWGNPVLYETNGTAFVLVSYGKDGVPDGVDYWEMREAPEYQDPPPEICGSWNSDQVSSDRGFHQYCGKE